ncbi:hypothetical protein D9M70_426470 [compost metagenome]
MRRRHHGVEVEVEIQRHRVDARVHPAAGQQRRQARGEAQARVVAAQVQRLDAEAVAGEEQGLAVALPDGEGEHAVEFRQQRGAPGVIALEQHLGVAVGMEAVAERLQFGAQFRVVVEGAVEGQGEAQVGVDHRLRRGVGQLHDLQPAVAEGDRGLGVEAPGVGAAGGHVVGDFFKRGQVGRLVVEA